MEQFRHHLTGETIAVEIESQWTARPREQVGIFATVRARSAEENERGSWTPPRYGNPENVREKLREARACWRLP